jgi:predicted unusual protein kinase regulating ubiquinone biosynthesis (AarF/ABC1/UbiB family)
MVERCRTPELVIEPETFALKIQHIVLSVKSTTFTLKAIRISDILTEVLKSVQQSHVKMEGDFINTVLSILLLEGIGRQLDPELDLFKSALPILRQVGGRLGTKDITGMPGHDLGAMIKVRPSFPSILTDRFLSAKTTLLSSAADLALSRRTTARERSQGRLGRVHPVRLAHAQLLGHPSRCSLNPLLWGTVAKHPFRPRTVPFPQPAGLISSRL